MCISLVVCFMISHVTITKMLVRARVSTRSSVGEGFNFKFSHVIVGRMQFFMDLELMRASVFLLAVGRRPPPVPWPVGHSTELLVTWQLDTSA